MAAKQFVPPEVRRWPAHWQRPTDGDLAVAATGYRHGAVPPHDQRLNQAARRLEPGSPRCQEVATRLYEVARAEQKAGHRRLGGLAAPQIGMPVRALLYDPREDADGPPGVDELACVINPTVQALEGPHVRLPEGCVSTGQVVGWVVRPDRVRLDGYLLNGERIQRDYSGRAARALLHEADHLNGRRFPDHTHEDDLLWVPAERRSEFSDHVKAVLRGEDIPPWPMRTPPDQWTALRNGLAVFGELEETTADQGPQ